MFRFIKNHRMFFNSFIYGSFYTGAELMQQSYHKKFQVELPLDKNVSTISDDVRKPGPVLQIVHRFNDSLGLDRDNDFGSQDYNLAQIKRYAIYGCLIAGPALHIWYKWLDSVYKGTAAKVIIKKLFVDQFVLTPGLLISFYTSMSLMESKTDILEEFKHKFVKTFQTSCLYWLPIQLVNFMIVPPLFRVVYVSVAAFCWVNILLYLKRSPVVPNTST